jgi:hypothetical protein
LLRKVPGKKNNNKKKEAFEETSEPKRTTKQANDDPVDEHPFTLKSLVTVCCFFEKNATLQRKNLLSRNLSQLIDSTRIMELNDKS